MLPDPTPSMLGERAAAQLLGVTPSCLRTWRARRMGPPYLRLAKRAIRYQLADLLLWASTRRVEPNHAVTAGQGGGQDAALP